MEFIARAFVTLRKTNTQGCKQRLADKRCKSASIRSVGLSDSARIIVAYRTEKEKERHLIATRAAENYRSSSVLINLARDARIIAWRALTLFKTVERTRLQRRLPLARRSFFLSKAIDTRRIYRGDSRLSRSYRVRDIDGPVKLELVVRVN